MDAWLLHKMDAPITRCPGPDRRHLAEYRQRRREARRRARHEMVTEARP
jgi:hypothetical protein